MCDRVRVLYSFPHKIGAARICHTAWEQVNGLANAGADVLVVSGSVHRLLPPRVRVRTTLARGKVRIPYKLFGTMRSCAMHDWLVSRQLQKMAGQVDIVHAWPIGAVHTLKTASRMGIPTVLERPNAHTRFAYEVVKEECERLGVNLPPGHEHAFKAAPLRKEEEEYQLAYRLLCPSDFVASTFLERGFTKERLARHQYGFDEKIYYPGQQESASTEGLSMIFVGGCAPRKGVHYALEAWLKSPAHSKGTFSIVGEFIPGYAEKLAPLLSHPSVRVLGHRNNVAELMRQNDVLVLPSIEEGSALVTSEARGSGCVLLVSEATGAICKHGENALMHSVGDVQTLTQHITMLHNDRQLLQKLRSASLRTVHGATWSAAGKRLLDVYKETIDMYFVHAGK